MHTKAFHDHECGACGVGIDPDDCPVVPLHDYEDNYYMAKLCHNCETVLMRIHPGDSGLERHLRAAATLDPDAGEADRVLKP